MSLANINNEAGENIRQLNEQLLNTADFRMKEPQSMNPKTHSLNLNNLMAIG